MSTPDSESFSHFSANSKSLKQFRFQQKLRGLLILVVIGAPLLIGVIAYREYRNNTDPLLATNQPAAIVPVEASDPASDPATIASSSTTTPAPTPSAGGTASGGATAQAKPSAQATSPAPVTTGMPAGVTNALNSIEQAGLKNNPYVNADTSQVPAGTVVKANRASWQAYGQDIGSVSGTITLQGQTRNGSITFQIVNGTWKATGYSIDS